MFNLLPKETKEAIRREYRLRLLAVVLFFGAATFLMASALLVPSLLLSRAKERATAAQYENLSKSIAIGEAAHLDETLTAARDTLKLVLPPPSGTPLYVLLARIAGAKPARLALHEVTVTTAASGKERLDLQGVAADRSVLLAFTDALEGLHLFEHVELPLGNLAKDADIDFSLTVIPLP